jgi:hypothetical protein
MGDKKTLLGLSRIHLDQAKSFASSVNTRFALTGLFVDPAKKSAMATDGKIAVIIPLEEGDPEAIPAIEGLREPLIEPVILPVGGIEKAIKLLPSKSAVPALMNAYLSRSGQEGNVNLSVSDLEASGSVTVRPVEGQFPDVSEAMPKRKGKTLIVGISAHILSRLAGFAVRHAGEDAGITFTFNLRHPQEVVTFSFELRNGKMATGGLAPLKFNEPPVGNETAAPAPSPAETAVQEANTAPVPVATVQSAAPVTDVRGDVAAKTAATAQPAEEPPQVPGPVPPAFEAPIVADSGRPDEAKAPVTGETPAAKGAAEEAGKEAGEKTVEAA